LREGTGNGICGGAGRNRQTSRGETQHREQTLARERDHNASLRIARDRSGADACETAVVDMKLEKNHHDGAQRPGL
jgi:hypothetical protein